ncbi:MAG TPA: GyrI-like domain-containing protein [Candidatus Acidoferrales bacterium]|nr:GyrI-like domain-containing protein [Candidatus Acidoferrales bacterium]
MSELRVEQVTLEPVPVLVAAEKGAPGEVAMRAFDRLEKALGDITGRKFYGYYAPDQREYRACVAVKDGDDAEKLGLARETLPGGKYVRSRLVGEPPELYRRIGPAFDDLGNINDTKDFMRPYIEFYRARNEVDLLVPIL